VQLPDERQKSCVKDYNKAKFAWDLVLKTSRRSADQEKSSVEVSYGPGPGKLDAYSRSFRAIRFVETLSEHATARYVLPHPITMVMRSCGESGANWVPSKLTLTLCYEMAEEFVELYQGYTEKRSASQRKMQSNELIAQNVKRIRLQHNMTMANLATGANLPETWVNRMEHGLENCTVDQLEKLARALKVETAAFFVQPTDKVAAVETKSRSRK
jgi:hypothetical protein